MSDEIDIALDATDDAPRVSAVRLSEFLRVVGERDEARELLARTDRALQRIIARSTDPQIVRTAESMHTAISAHFRRKP